MTRPIHCCACDKIIDARLTDGAEIYPHRPDLSRQPFWICDTCRNYVGCHHKTSNPTNPLGHIPTPEIRNARKLIHALLDPLWQSANMRRSDLYRQLSEKLGWKFHTSKIKTIEEARDVYRLVQQLAKEQPTL